MAAPDRPAFARALRAFRLHVGVTQIWLSKAIGKDQGMVSDWEIGHATPDNATVLAMERVMELAPGTLSQFLGWVPFDTSSLPDPPNIQTHRGVIPGADMALIEDFVFRVAGPESGLRPNPTIADRLAELERAIASLGGGLRPSSD